MAGSCLLLFSWSIQASTPFCPHQGRKPRRQFPWPPHRPIHSLGAALAHWEWAVLPPRRSSLLQRSPAWQSHRLVALIFSSSCLQGVHRTFSSQKGGMFSGFMWREHKSESFFPPLFPDPREYKQQIQFNLLTHNTQNTSSDSRNEAITRPLPTLLNNA